MASSKNYFNFVSNIVYFASGGFIGAAIAKYKQDFGHAQKGDGKGQLSEVSSLGVSNKTNQQNQQLDKFFNLSEERPSKRLLESIEKARTLCERVKVKQGLPGLAVAVTVNGKTRWTEGFGYANLENDIRMEPETVVRIGSISKSMTMAMLGKFMEDEKVDLDIPVQTYIPNFPKKEFEGKEVTITTRHLLSHLSGIRHYSKKEELDALEGEAVIDEMNLKEYFLKEKFASVEKSLELFQDDALLHEPGAKHTYTTHGWTLVSAVLEKVAGKPFDKYAKQMFQTWGLKNTFLDEPEPIIYNRAAPYTLDKKTGRIQNSPYVDNSYKWAGGGFVSTVCDVAQFGNIMLASFQNQGEVKGSSALTENSYQGQRQLLTKGYLKSDTVGQMWRGDPRTTKNGSDRLYGLGFHVAEPMRKCLFCSSRELMTVGHGGAAIGGSATLLITFPKDVRFTPDQTDSPYLSDPCQGQENVKGISVAMLTNLTDANLQQSAEEITKLFEWLI